MEGFVDEGPVHHEAGVVEPGAELGGYDVEVEFAADGYVALVREEEVFGRAAGVGGAGGEVESVGVGPLEGAGEEGAPGFELAGEFADDVDGGTAVGFSCFGFGGGWEGFSEIGGREGRGLTSVDSSVDAGDEAAEGDHGQEVVLEVWAFFCERAGGGFVAVMEGGGGDFVFEIRDARAR